MPLTRLNINRNLIEKTLSKNVATLEPAVKKGNNEVHFRAVMSNGDKALIIFYYNADGTTSISPRDPNKELGKELAILIANSCVYSDKKSISLFISLQPNDYDTIIEYLQSECDAELTETKTILGGTQVKLTGTCGNQLVIKYFTKKANLQVQGKPLSLYEDLIEILCELLPYEQFVNSQLKQINVDLDSSIVKGELESRLPQSYDFIGEKVQAIISPSLVLNKLDIELDDYTAIVMPVLRGLEGYIKQIFTSKGYTVDRNFGCVINGNNGNPYVISSVQANINCQSTVNAIEKCYTYWTQQRHGLFHVDGNVETTRTLESNEAQELINKTLELIETTYAAIPN